MAIPSASKLKKYGLTERDWVRLFNAQGQECPVCRRNGDGIRWVVDHCHDSGTVRGILCNECNTAFGMIREHSGVAARLLAYALVADFGVELRKQTGLEGSDGLSVGQMMAHVSALTKMWPVDQEYVNGKRTGQLRLVMNGGPDAS